MKKQLTTAIAVFAATAVLFLGIGAAIGATSISSFPPGSSTAVSCAAGSARITTTLVRTESETVNCPLPTTTTTVAPTTTTTVAPTTTTTAAPTSTAPPSYSCSQPEPGDCFFPADTTNFVGMNNPYATFGGTSSLGTVVANNFNDPISKETQSIGANSASDWEVTNNTPTNASGGITDYPSNGIYAYTGIVDDYTSLAQTYNLTMPIAGVGGTNDNSISWATSDDWLSEPAKADQVFNYEIQIHVDTSDSTGGHGCSNATSTVSNISIGGQLWLFCDYQTAKNSNGTCPNNGDCGEAVFVLGGTYADRVATPTASGSINLKAMIQWLEDNDVPGQSYPYIEAGSALSAMSRGWEIVSTGGATQTFSMNGFTVDAVGAPTPLSTAPTGVTFTPGTAPTCVVKWSAVSGATSYDLWSGQTGFVRVTGTSYTVTGTAGTPIGGVEVAASNSGGQGRYSGFTNSCTPT